MSAIKNFDKLLTPAEVAERVGVSPITVRSWVTKGLLASTRVTPGGHRRYLWKDVEKLLEKRESPPTGLNILVIDDDAQFRGYLVSALITLLPDAKINEAMDGFQAGILMAEILPDLVLLDYAMPRINGVEVCKMIKANPTYAAARIVAVTGFADAEIHTSLMNVGVDKIMLKPFTIKEIEKMLEAFDFPVAKV